MIYLSGLQLCDFPVNWLSMGSGSSDESHRTLDPDSKEATEDVWSMQWYGTLPIINSVISDNNKAAFLVNNCLLNEVPQKAHFES